MNLLQLLLTELTAGAGSHPAVDAAAKAVRAFQALPVDETTAQKAGNLASALLPIVTPLLPAASPVLAVIAACEPFVGPAVTWLVDEGETLETTPDNGVAVTLPSDAPAYPTTQGGSYMPGSQTT